MCILLEFMFKEFNVYVACGNSDLPSVKSWSTLALQLKKILIEYQGNYLPEKSLRSVSL